MASRDSNEYLKGLALLAWIGAEIIALTGAGIGIGWALNRWLGTPLLLTLPLGLMGLALAFWRIYRASKILEKKE